MRLGDLDSLFCRFWGKADPFKEQTLVRPCTVWSDAATMAREAPTIDPETLPIVRQLREELANCKQELRQIKYYYDIAKNGEKQFRKQNDEIIASWAECAKKLKQVTAERDAAVKDLEQAIDIYRDDEGWDLLCRFCNGKSCREKKECVPKWRGLKKEE